MQPGVIVSLSCGLVLLIFTVYKIANLGMTKRINGVTDRVNEIKTDTKDKCDKLETDSGEIKREMKNVQIKFTKDITELKSDIKYIKNSADEIKKTVTKIQYDSDTFRKNNIKPETVVKFMAEYHEQLNKKKGG